MATHTDVAFAVTLKLDKLIRETLNMAAEGAACLEILGYMFTEERAGWKLYHDADAVWYTDDIDGAPVPVLHALLTDLAEDQKTCHEISYFRLHKELEFENLCDHDGEYEDPFRIGYSLKLQYEEKKPEPPPPPPPKKKVEACPKRKRKTKSAPKRRGQKRSADR